MAAKVLAIDVGYGFVKWSRRRDNTIVKGIFPSIVVPTPPWCQNSCRVTELKLTPNRDGVT